MPRDQRLLIGWFGIRGIGSIYYLLYAIGQGLPGPLAQLMLSIVLTAVAASIVVHGISVTPLMNLYSARRKSRRAADRTVSALLLRLCTPKLLKARVASAVAAVKLVAHRIFLVIVLVIFLGRIKRAWR